MNGAQGLNFVPTLPPEEAARADLYGLLARLFAAGPDAQVLSAIATAPADFGSASPLGQAWTGVQAAARTVDAATALLEHSETFVGTGRAPISIYASHYLSDQWKEMTVVELRDRLPQLGLARQAGVNQPEDHLAALLEVMCHLVRRGNEAGGMTAQCQFFERYLGPWYARFCAAVDEHADLRFYRNATFMLKAFLDIEAEAFGFES